MLRDITIGKYYSAESPIHRMDPRTKILWLIFYMVILFAIKSNPLQYAVFLTATVIIGLLTRVPFGFILRGLKPVMVLVIFTVSLNVLFTPGESVLWQWSFITITTEGLHLAFFMALRLVLLIVGSTMLTLTTSPLVMTDGLESLLRPLKRIGVPAHELSMMMSIALRFIPTLLEETDRIIKAQTARGSAFEGGKLSEKVHALIPLLVPLFVSAFRRADDLAMAMEARCYHGGEGRTSMHSLKFTRVDAAAAVCAAAFAGIIVLAGVL
ncbi:MAG: energy-coupling factor transporter transmembrane component T [Clostridia bacterium]|nr:energy-coupling factor transporter transmembrane component T [Clostridia bacterium]